MLKEDTKRYMQIASQNQLGKEARQLVQTTELLREFLETPEYADLANQVPIADLYALCELAPSLSLEEIQSIRGSYPTPLLYSQHIYLESLLDRRTTPKVGGDNRVIGSVGHLKQGYTPPHSLPYVCKGVEVTIEFPEIMIHNDDKSYVARIKRADVAEVEKELLVSLAYCYRYAITTNNVIGAAADVINFKEKKLVKLIDKAKKWSETVKTIDEQLLPWAEEALKYCNTIDQTKVVVEIYSEACRFTQTQPVIAKQRIADRAGVDRKVVRRLVGRMVRAGLITQSPEHFRIEDGKSDARILNLGSQPDRWAGQTFRTPNRSPEHLEDRRVHKARLEHLRQNQATPSTGDGTARQVQATALEPTSEE